MDSDRKIDFTVQALRYTVGGTAFVAGLDKFFNYLTDWEKYLSPAARKNLPITGRNFMRLVGVIEMAVGAVIVGGKTRIGGYVAGAWLAGIAANLVANGDYDIAARDVNMAVGALALAQLTNARRVQRTLEESPIETHRAA